MSVKLLLPWLASALFACSAPDPIPVPSGGPEALPPDVLVAAGEGEEICSPAEKRLLRMAGEFLDISRKRGESIWPGWKVEQMPLGIWREKNRLFLINHEDAPPGMRAAAQEITTFPVYVGTPPMDSMRTAVVPLRGRAVVMMDASREENLVPRLFHLAAHQFFQHHFRRAYPCMPLHGPIDAKRTDPRRDRLERLEVRILEEALRCPEKEDAVREAAFFLRVREARRSGTPLGDVIMEKHWETSEGLAWYVRLKALAASAPSACLEILGAMGHSGAFTTGMAQAFLLDRLDEGWKAAYLEEKGPALEDLLSQRVEFLLMSGP